MLAYYTLKKNNFIDVKQKFYLQILILKEKRKKEGSFSRIWEKGETQGSRGKTVQSTSILWLILISHEYKFSREWKCECGTFGVTIGCRISQKLS